MLERLFNNIAAYITPSSAEATFATAVLWQANPLVQSLTA